LLPAEECHGLVTFLVERHGQVVVLRHERSLENLINALYPVSSLCLRLSRELQRKRILILLIIIISTQLIMKILSYPLILYKHFREQVKIFNSSFY